MREMNVMEMQSVNAGLRYWGFYFEHCKACGYGYYSKFCTGINSFIKAMEKGASKWKSHKKACAYGGRGGFTIKWDW